MQFNDIQLRTRRVTETLYSCHSGCPWRALTPFWISIDDVCYGEMSHPSLMHPGHVVEGSSLSSRRHPKFSVLLAAHCRHLILWREGKLGYFHLRQRGSRQEYQQTNGYCLWKQKFTHFIKNMSWKNNTIYHFDGPICSLDSNFTQALYHLLHNIEEVIIASEKRV